jgi:hypothetical protein
MIEDEPVTVIRVHSDEGQLRGCQRRPRPEASGSPSGGGSFPDRCRGDAVGGP